MIRILVQLTGRLRCSEQFVSGRMILSPANGPGCLNNGDQPIMPNDNENACIRRKGAFRCLLSINGSGHTAILALAAMIVLSQSACLFKRNKEAVMPSAPVRIAFLPFNTPEGDKDLLDMLQNFAAAS